MQVAEHIYDNRYNPCIVRLVISGLWTASRGPHNGGIYRQAGGDSLSKIATGKLGSAGLWRVIAALNGIINPNRIRVGQRLQLPVKKGEIMSDQVVYTSKSRIERIKGPLRRAYLPQVKDPVFFGMHSEVAAHYGVDPQDHEPQATTLDYVVASAAG